MSEFIKIIKERHLIADIKPIASIVVMFLALYLLGLDLLKPEAKFVEGESNILFPSIKQIIYFVWGVIVFIQLWHFSVKLHREPYVDAFAYLLGRIGVISLTFYLCFVLYPKFTHKEENYWRERTFYWAEVRTRNPKAKDGRKEKLVWFGGTCINATTVNGGKECAKACGVVYDGADIFLNPDSKYRGLDIWWLNEFGYFDEDQALNLNTENSTKYKVPITAKKLDPYFYYTCFDFEHAQKITDDKNQTKKQRSK